MMSVIDKFLDVMRLNSDEDYDEFYNDDFEMEEDEPESFVKSLTHLEDYIRLEQVRFGDQAEENVKRKAM